MSQPVPLNPQLQTPSPGAISLFDAEDFPDLWHSGVWGSLHGWAHIVSDVLIWFSCMTISLLIFYYLDGKPELPRRSILWLFIAFMLLGGFTHLMEAFLFYWPAYRFLGLLKLATAVVSVATIVCLIIMLPKLLQASSMKKVEEETAKRREAERRLIQRQESMIHELEQRTRDLRQIIYVASHDLRSPLVNIIGFSAELERSLHELHQLLQLVESPAPQIKRITEDDLPGMLQYIAGSARRMDRLLKGLLQYSRLGRYPVEIQRIDMRALMMEITQDLSFQLKEIGAEVKIGSLPQCYGDLTLVGRLFRNLMDNAIKYRSEERPLKLSMEAESLAGRICYSLWDNGLGIAKDHQEKVFEVFHRLDPDKSEGDGLGLSICRLVTQRMEGRIWLESTPGVGSCFHVELPGNGHAFNECADAIADPGLNQS